MAGENSLFQLPNILTAGQPAQNSNFNPDVWGGTPYLPGQGGFNSMQQYGQPPPQGGGFNMNTLAQGLGAFQSLASIYGMFKNMGFQKKAFRFAQEGTKRNFNASAQAFNNNVDDRWAARNASAQLDGRDFQSLADYGAARKVKNWE